MDDEETPSREGTTNETPNQQLKAIVRVIVEEFRPTNGGSPQIFQPTVYEQTMPANKIDVQAIIEAANKNLKEEPAKSSEPAAPGQP